MSDTATEAPAEQAPTETTEQGKPDEGLGDAGKKALDAMKSERNKATRRAAELEARLQEIEDREKTEAEKVSERAQAAEDRAAKAESKAERLEVAFEKGLTPAQAKRLVGETREELEADADEILRDFPVKSAEEPKPSVDLDLGSRTAELASRDPRAADLAQIEADLKATKRR